MSRSYRKHSFCGNTCAESEKWDKRFANRCYRRLIRMLLAHGEEMLPLLREVSDVWLWAKDGVQRLDADTIAIQPGLMRK